MNDSSKEPEPGHANHHSESDHVLNDSTKEPENAPAEPTSHLHDNEAKQGKPSMCDDNNNDSKATIIYEVPKLSKCKIKRKSKVNRQLLQVKIVPLKKKLPKHHFVCSIYHHKFAKDNSWYKHEK